MPLLDVLLGALNQVTEALQAAVSFVTNTILRFTITTTAEPKKRMSLSKEESEALIRLLALDADRGFELLKGGYSNANYKVYRRGIPLVIKLSFEKSMDECKSMLLFFEAMRAAKVPAVFPVPLPSGTAAADPGKFLLALPDKDSGSHIPVITFEYFDGTAPVAADFSGAEARLLGEALGRLSVTDISALPKLPEFFSKLNEVEAFVASVDADPKHVAKGHRVIDFFRGACAATRKDMAAAGVDLAKLPRGLLHGDMSFGNFMCPTGGGPIHLLDFEEACNDACVIELAVTIAFMCVTKPPDLDLALVQPLIEGYATGRGAEFNSDERKAFNFAMRVALLGTCLWRFETYNVKTHDAKMCDWYRDLENIYLCVTQAPPKYFR